MKKLIDCMKRVSSRDITWKHYASNTLVDFASTSPFIVATDLAAGVPEIVSLNNRGISLASQLFTGLIDRTGREVLRSSVGIKQETPEILKKAHDFVYYMGVVSIPTFVTLSASYLTSNEDYDLESIAVASLGRAAVTIIPNLFKRDMEDLYHVFFGLENPPNIPERIRSMKKSTKLGLAGLITSAFIGGSALLYGLHEDTPEPTTPQYENISEQPYQNL